MQKKAQYAILVIAVLAIIVSMIYSKYSKSTVQPVADNSKAAVATTAPSNTQPEIVPIPEGSLATSSLKIGKSTFVVEVPSTEDEMAIGLGGRLSLAPQHGMLFAFNAPDLYTFWMKDMKFPLDILWVDGENKINHIEANLTPETYPKTYISEEPALFVVELEAGTVSKYGIRVGEKVEIR